MKRGGRKSFSHAEKGGGGERNKFWGSFSRFYHLREGRMFWTRDFPIL